MSENPIDRIVSIIDQAEPVGAFQAGTETGTEGVEANSANEPEAPADDDGGTDDVGPKDWGFDIDRMNREWAFVLMGSKAVVVREQDVGPIEDRVRVVGLDGFRALFMNKPTQILNIADGKIKTVTWGDRWLRHSKRRSFNGIEFFPNPDGAESTPGYLNLYRGFSVTPAPKPNGWGVLRDHMLTNICHGDKELFDWLFGWFAHLLQRPRERVGTALVFRGRMGAGKSIVGEIMGSLIASHYFLVGDARYITGNFNAHMASCLLLQAEEAVWAGDKAAEGRLKDLVTAEIQMIEQKSIDPIRLKNFVRLIMTSNEDWVVPAGKDERRFAVLDVHPRCAQNHEYFAEMRAEIENGGREALLHDLMTFDLSKVNLRKIPMTKALLEQKFRSLDTVEAWWLERLIDGTTRRGGSEWGAEVPIDALFDDYIAVSEKIGVKRKSEKTSFGMKMMKLVPGLAKVRPWITDEDMKRARQWCYALPQLHKCRDAFEQAVGQKIEWNEGDDHAPERDRHEGV
ncbi:primase-helicase family protein [Kaistia sp. MMO-174]|uniref:primase-helicase family protein n=1 Tax=Kaistia sp. MMO-174 TaxID=3081256 RepID=UPI00301AC409